MCSVFHYSVYVFHLIKFVSFCCYRIFLVNKDIHNTEEQSEGAFIRDFTGCHFDTVYL